MRKNLDSKKSLDKASELVSCPKLLKQIGYKYSSALSDSYEARDVIHDIYLKIHETIEKGKEISHVEPWIRTTIRNLSLTHNREKEKEQKNISLDSRLRDSDGCDSLRREETIPSDKHITSIDALVKTEKKEEQLKCLKQALKALKEGERKLLKLRIIHEIFWKEIAECPDFKENQSTLR